MSFQQPSRRDWLFHFQQQQPLVSDAVRRATVRVMGDRVTQFATTIKIPDAVYRENSEQRLVDVFLVLLKIGGLLAAMALVIAGAIVATRNGGAIWKRAGRLTLILAIIPILSAMARYESRLFSYSTSVAWDTFRLNLITDIVRGAGLQILVLFVAIAGILAALPFAPRLLSREGRARLGMAAGVAAVTAISILVIVTEATRLIASALPRFASIDELSIPDTVGLRFPALLETGEALIGAIIVSGIAALYAVIVRTWKPGAVPVVTIAILFAVTIDMSVLPGEWPLMMATSIIFAVAIWIVARYILRGNPLAWLLTAFVASILQSAAALLRNDRLDLRMQAGMLVLLAIVTLFWTMRRSPGTAEPIL